MTHCYFLAFPGDEYVDDDEIEIPDEGEIVIEDEEDEEEIVIEESQLTESTFNSTVRYCCRYQADICPYGLMSSIQWSD